MDDTYDFYKGDMLTNYPSVDGKLSIKCYFDGLYNCYSTYRKRFLNKSANGIRINETKTSTLIVKSIDKYSC